NHGSGHHQKASSFKEALENRGGSSSGIHTAKTQAYLVDLAEDIPSLTIENPEVEEYFKKLTRDAVVVRFNGFWPSSTALYQWVYKNWTNKCEISLCSKGFFIVHFRETEDYQRCLTEGPWFWGHAGLFITPWFPDFNPNTYSVTKTPVWVRLPNLPLHLWYALEDIGNVLGKFIKEDMDRTHSGLCSFAQICIELDLSKGLPDRINLKFGNFQHTHVLDYENTAFRCRLCKNAGQIQASCPFNKNQKSEKENGSKSSNGWGSVNPDLVSASKFKDNPYNPYSDGKMVTEKNDTEMGFQEENLVGGGIKRGHTSKSSDSDQDSVPSNLMVLVNPSDLALVISSDLGKWQEVKRRKNKKGRMGSIDDYFPSQGG
ncbi:hypothetical protein KI387_005827, partial [Taxus chinensis]